MVIGKGVSPMLKAALVLLASSFSVLILRSWDVALFNTPEARQACLSMASLSFVFFVTFYFTHVKYSHVEPQRARIRITPQARTGFSSRISVRPNHVGAANTVPQRELLHTGL